LDVELTTGRKGRRALEAVAVLLACTCSRAPALPADAAVADAAPTAPAAASSSVPPRAGFDRSLFVGAGGRTLVGQVLDGNDRPLRDIVVYVRAGLPPGKYTPPPRPVIVDQRDKTFVPHVVPLLAGTSVTFTNADAVLHDVYSRSPPKTMDLGAFGSKETRTTVFDKPGRVDVFCAIHTNMHAIFLVLDNPYFAATDERGYFVIKEVPVGNLTVTTWSDQRDPQDARVEISADRPAILETRLH
jgi:hypothetical protein